jgi:hypothetical protein
MWLYYNILNVITTIKGPFFLSLWFSFFQKPHLLMCFKEYFLFFFPWAWSSTMCNGHFLASCCSRPCQSRPFCRGRSGFWVDVVANVYQHLNRHSLKMKKDEYCHISQIKWELSIFNFSASLQQGAHEWVVPKKHKRSWCIFQKLKKNLIFFRRLLGGIAY